MPESLHSERFLVKDAGRAANAPSGGQPKCLVLDQRMEISFLGGLVRELSAHLHSSHKRVLTLEPFADFQRVPLPVFGGTLSADLVRAFWKAHSVLPIG